MTTTELLALIWRWRILVPIGVLVTVGGLVHVRGADPLYWSQTQLRVIAPANSVAANTLTASSNSLISMAGLVVREVDRAAPAALSDSANLPGLGIREGWQLRLPNSGGQWEPNFSQPIIDVQVVGSDPAQVEQTRQALTRRVARELDSLQAADGIPPESRMTLHPDAVSPPVVEMGGSRARAELIVVVLGAWATLAAVLAADQILARVRRIRVVRRGAIVATRLR